MMAFHIRCAAVLFDLDGVLVDSAECVEQTWRQWAVEHSIDPEQVIQIAHGRRTIETIRLVAPHLQPEREAVALAVRESNTTAGVYEVPGARDLLQRLPSDSWAVVTSGVRTVATLRIRHTGLPMPRVLVCADDIARGKPDPEGYLRAADLLGVSAPQCVVIEDAPAGLQAARAAGMRVIGVSGTFAADALAVADARVTRFSELQFTVTGPGSRIEISAVPA